MFAWEKHLACEKGLEQEWGGKKPVGGVGGMGRAAPDVSVCRAWSSQQSRKASLSERAGDLSRVAQQVSDKVEIHTQVL